MGGKTKAAKEKPLEKMTATELRGMAKELEGITGVHGMNKDELVKAIKKAKGIEDNTKAPKTSMRDIKAKIRALKVDRSAALEADDSRMSAILRRKISRLKKQTRRTA